MAKYKVTDGFAIKADGEFHQGGDVVELTKEQADSFGDLVSPVSEPKTETASLPKKAPAKKAAAAKKAKR
jgi:hypothetical protein